MKSLSLLLVVGLLSFTILNLKDKPVLYIIGDSTVQNNDGNGKNEYWGWGTLLKPYFDSTKIELQNHAKSGTSTRTFRSDGRWNKILTTLKKGDFVIMQFGHNDNSPIDDTAKEKGTLKGTGEDSVLHYNVKKKTDEVIHTYGWYMRQFVTEAKAKGATVIICSLVPRKKWKNNKVVKELEYPEWSEETAKKTGAYFMNLNRIVAGHWEEMGEEKVKEFFPIDGTHTNQAGAELNAASVIEGLKQIKDCPLNKFLK